MKAINIEPADPWLRWRLRWTWSKDNSAAVSNCADVIIHDETIIIPGQFPAALVYAVLTHGAKVFLKNRAQHHLARVAPVYMAAAFAESVKQF